MKARERVAVLVCAVSTYLALPVAAASAQQIEIHPGGIELQIPLGGKHNYFASLTAKDDQRVKLREGELFSSAGYSVPGHVSSRHIEADFGPLGSVDVKIHLRRRRPGPPPGRNCSGRPTISFEGSYRGTIEFAGERDIPEVHSRHGRVIFVHRFRRICTSPKPAFGQGKEMKGPSNLEIGILTASSQGEGRTVGFDVFDLASRREPSLSFGLVVALVYERLDQVRVSRSTLGFAGGKELAMSERGSPETFKVNLEEPFSGRAVFSRARQVPSTWTGNLAVKLPGAPRTPLTGPSFITHLCRASSVARIKPCIAEDSLSRPLVNFRNDSFRSFLTRTGIR